ncbi:DMT family transporter [Alsobacter sp. KACC 23698]|uniref:DMT family transporter n=1 Tax=Alsobacter sp. KACC 23698 TaxID=3149229 RepID=A0AAU7JFU9_9HYPH
MRRDHIDRKAMALLTALCALWGVQQVTAKIALEGVSPVMQAGLRSCGSAILLGGWAWSRGIRIIGDDGAWKPGLVVGALFALEFLLLYQGIAWTTASRGIVFLYTAPFTVAAGAHWLFPQERLVGWQLVGLFAAFAGVVLAFGDGLASPDWRALAGDALCFGAAVLWGLTTLVIKSTRLASISATRTLFFQLFVSGVALTPLSPLLGEPGVVSLTPAVVAALAYQTVVVGFVSYLCWFWMIATYPAAQLSAFTFLTPLLGVAAGWAFLGDPLRPGFAGAIGLVCLGIWLVNRRPATAA